MEILRKNDYPREEKRERICEGLEVANGMMKELEMEAQNTSR